jgi:hypothetical protein
MTDIMTRDYAADESWFIEAAVQAIPARPTNSTSVPVAMSQTFVTGTKRYTIVVRYNPVTRLGNIALNVEVVAPKE